MGLATVTLSEANITIKMIRQSTDLTINEKDDMLKYLLSVPELIDEALKQKMEGCMEYREAHKVIGNVWQSVMGIKNDVKNAKVKPFQSYIQSQLTE